MPTSVAINRQVVAGDNAQRFAPGVIGAPQPVVSLAPAQTITPTTGLSSGFASLKSRTKSRTANGCGHPGRGENKPEGFLEVQAKKFVTERLEQKRRDAGGNHLVVPMLTHWVELGAGDGDLPAKISILGGKAIRVTAIDCEDNFDSAALALCQMGSIKQIVKPVQAVQKVDWALPYIDGLSARRLFSWLPYDDAEGVLKKHAAYMCDGAHLFISVMSYDCKHADIAAPATVNIRKRFAQSGTHSGTFGAPRVPYTKPEFENLLKTTGFTIRNGARGIIDTDGGLLKAVAIRSRQATGCKNGRVARL